jgi:hypothetical protein
MLLNVASAEQSLTCWIIMVRNNLKHNPIVINNQQNSFILFKSYPLIRVYYSCQCIVISCYFDTNLVHAHADLTPLLDAKFKGVNILEDDTLRQTVKEYS